VAHADAIVILGGGDETRPFAAAQLYKAGFAQRILISNAKLGGPIEKLGILPSEAEIDREVLVKLGIPGTALTVIGSGLSSTYDEAQAIAAWARKTGAKRVIIPTEIFPSRRVHWIFNHELEPLGVAVLVIAYPHQDYSADTWWRVHSGILDFQNEILKDVYYHLHY
jgi:uncharacterized SAM-binding protein YcdF (DUF218 family)